MADVKLSKTSSNPATYQTADGYRAVRNGMTWKLSAPDGGHLRPARNLDEVRATIATVRNMDRPADPNAGLKGTLIARWWPRRPPEGKPDGCVGQAYAGGYEGLLSAVHGIRGGLADGTTLKALVTASSGLVVLDSERGIDRAPYCQICSPGTPRADCRYRVAHRDHFTPGPDGYWLTPEEGS